MIRVDEFDEKSNKSNFKKNISMNSNTIKDSSSLYLKIADNAGGSKTYRKPTKELVRDPSKTNLAVKLTKHNRNNSYDISKNEKEKTSKYMSHSPLKNVVLPKGVKPYKFLSTTFGLYHMIKKKFLNAIKQFKVDVKLNSY